MILNEQLFLVILETGTNFWTEQEMSFFKNLHSLYMYVFARAEWYYIIWYYHFQLSVCFTDEVIYHLKYSMNPWLLEFCTLLEPTLKNL